MDEELVAQVFTKTFKESKTFAGGIPYLREGEGWPINSNKKPLLFLFQVDLSDVPDLGLNLPDKGILQFFHEDDELYGMNLNEYPDFNPNGLVRIIDDYVENPELNTPDTGNSPLRTPEERVYYKGKTVFTKTFEDYQNAQDNFDKEEEFETDPLVDSEFWLGGHPRFTQDDFRSEDKVSRLVLVLGSSSGSNIMWGDVGFGSYWIDEDSLNDNDWSQCFLYWDCY